MSTFKQLKTKQIQTEAFQDGLATKKKKKNELTAKLEVVVTVIV